MPPGRPVPSGSVAAVSKLKSLKARLRGDQLNAISAELAEIRQMLADMNHSLQSLMELNHEIRVGGSKHLPLFLGYSERLRTDADSSIAAAKVIERQLDVLDRRLAAFEARVAVDEPST